MRRSLPSFAIATGVVACGLSANAQAPGGLTVDFSGVYAPPVFVGVPAVTEPDVYPFTAEAERAYNAYDPAIADPRQGDDCAPETMPGILWSGSPMEIVQEDGRIVMRFERGNTVRSIPVDGAPAPADQVHTELGYSVAHWMEDVLTIETTHMIGGVIRNNMGHPLSRDARLVESYWREPGENDLQLELLVDDPVNYTKTFTLGREWIWSPDEQVRPWECISLGGRESDADLDELTRILEEL